MKNSNISFLALVFSAVIPSLSQAQNINFKTSCDETSARVSLAFTGDILIHDLLYRAVYDGSKNFEQIWKPTNEIVNKADFTVGNLEGPAALGISRNLRDHGDVGFTYDKNIYSGTNFSFNYHPRILSDLKRSGYDLITNANNHSLDRGSIGIDRTLQAARNIDFPVVGIRSSQDRGGSFHRVMNIKGFRIAFIGCTETTNGIADRKDQVLSCFDNSQRILGIIRELANNSSIDSVIVLPHWGQEYQPSPNQAQKRWGKAYIEAGASAVIGSHPHVLQPWEKHTTASGREGLIVYSLGNYIAGQAGIAKKTSALIYLGLGKTNNGNTQIYGSSYITTYREGTQVYPISDSRSEITRHAEKYFGSKRRANPQVDINKHLCQK